MTAQIIDTCALLKYVLPEDGTEVIEEMVRLHQESAIQLVAPDYIFVECANVLWKHVRRNNINLEGAVYSLRRLRSLEVRLVPQSELLEEALLFAADASISVYDALFCALARREDAPLITADAPLVNRLRGTDVRAFTLADWPGHI